MKIIISGLTASGKSTLARGISEELNLKYFSASSKLREIMPPRDFEFWESQKGLDVVKFRLKNLKYDRLLDDYILKYVKEHDNLVLDSWVASWKINDEKTIKIYLKVDLETRAWRVSQRGNMGYGEALKFMKEKDRLSAKIYYTLYKIKIAEDMLPFDLVINSAALSVESLKKVCLEYIVKRMKKWK